MKLEELSVVLKLTGGHADGQTSHRLSRILTYFLAYISRSSRNRRTEPGAKPIE